jgi:TM2 domain-containing membrane protein YozV
MNIPQNALPDAGGRVVGRKSAGLAVVLSFFPGLGQIYVGAIRRGFTHAAIFGGLIVLLSSGAAHGVEPAVGIMMAFFYFYNLIDAARMANLFNEMASGITPEEWRRDFLAGVGQRGSIGGGLALLVGGILFLLHTWFDVSLEFLSDWWPLLPVGLGAWLLWAGIRDRRKGRANGTA